MVDYTTLTEKIENKLQKSANDIVELNYLELASMLYRMAGDINYKAHKAKDPIKAEKLNKIGRLLNIASDLLKQI